MTEAGESGVVETGARLDDSPEWLDRACHSMIDAVSALTVNLDYLAYDAVGPSSPADLLLGMLQLVVQLAEGDEVAQAVVVVYAPVALVNLVVRVGGVLRHRCQDSMPTFCSQRPWHRAQSSFLRCLNPLRSRHVAIGRTVRPGINKSA